MTFNSGVCKFNIEDKYYYFELCKIKNMYFNLINNDGIELLPNDKNFEFSDDIVFIRGIEENMVQVYDLNGILRKVDVSFIKTLYKPHEHNTGRINTIYLRV